MLSTIKKKILGGKRLTGNDALKLFQTDDIHGLGQLAASIAELMHGKKAFYVRNLHINPTNICVNRCRFCAFSRSEGDQDAYALSVKDIIKKIRHAKGVNEVHIVGGLHPDWPFEHYLAMVAEIKRVFPKLHIKAFTATEIEYFARISGLAVEDVLYDMKKAGLGSMPGGGAEIFSPRVRGALCPEKLSGEGWLRVHSAAHLAGIKTNATMLYGHMESLEERVDHLMKLRSLQDKTRGFQAFIPLHYHPRNTEMGGRTASGIDDLKTIAVSRLVLDNFPHIKAYWVMLGEKLSQLALLYGADDLDGTIIEEKITHAAGGGSGLGITVKTLEHLITSAGKKPVERDSFYRAVRR